MTLASPVLRSLVVYILCMPLAIVMGYALATPLDLSNLGLFLMVAAILALPVILRWHQWMLLAAWNSTALLIIIPGRPSLWMALAGLSLTISLARRAASRSLQLLRVPMLNWPLAFIALVILVTAELTGGVGFRVFQTTELVGGKRYVEMLLAIVGYFAISILPIPTGKTRLAATLYFAGGITTAIGSLVYFLAPVMQMVYYLFPTDATFAGQQDLLLTRFYGFTVASQFFISVLLVRYGLRGIFFEQRWWRLAALLVGIAAALTGGFRSVVLMLMVLLVVQFTLEGLWKTKLVVPAVFGTLAAVFMLALLAPHMPLQVQRCLAFLPVEVDHRVRADADASTRWRLEMWREVLPEVPRYLLLGKGLSIDRADLELASSKVRSGLVENYYGSLISGDFHNGLLTVVLPFGIWGLIGFFWLALAGYRVMWRNYTYSMADRKIVNTFLFASYVTQLVLFVFVFGSFQTQLPTFTGILGLSVAINGGLRGPNSPMEEEAPPPSPLQVFRLPRPLSGD